MVLSGCNAVELNCHLLKSSEPGQINIISSAWGRDLPIGRDLLVYKIMIFL